LKGLPKDQLPSLKKIILKDGMMLLPIPVIIIFLLRGYTPTMAALWAIYVSLLLPLFRKENRYSLKDLYSMLGKGAMAALELIIICSMIGFIIGASTLTGFGLKLAGAIVDFAGGYLLPVLFLTMIASIILGAGIPTTGNYIMMALLTAPALKLMNVAPINAHLFVFYFGIISDLTPPVALAALVAAGLAGSPFWQTALTSTKLAVAGFIIPYMFVLNPDLLIKIDSFSLMYTGFNVITAIIGVIALAATVQNIFYIQMKIYERIPLFVAAILLILPAYSRSLLGFLIMVLVIMLQVRRARSGNFRTSISFGRGNMEADSLT